MAAPAAAVKGSTSTCVIIPVCVVLKTSCGAPGAGISGALIEVSLDGKTVPPCADTDARIVVHIASAISSDSKEAMMRIRSSQGVELSFIVASAQYPSVGEGEGEGEGEGIFFRVIKFTIHSPYARS